MIVMKSHTMIAIAVISPFQDPRIRDGMVCCARKVASTHMNATACDNNMHTISHLDNCGVNQTTYSAHQIQFWLTACDQGST